MGNEEMGNEEMGNEAMAGCIWEYYLSSAALSGGDMTICPVALAVGCKKCPIFSICPVKSVIGDHKKGATPASGTGAKKKASN
jgi:hypothetical protein